MGFPPVPRALRLPKRRTDLVGCRDVGVLRCECSSPLYAAARNGKLRLRRQEGASSSIGLPSASSIRPISSQVGRIWAVATTLTVVSHRNLSGNLVTRKRPEWAGVHRFPGLRKDVIRRLFGQVFPLDEEITPQGFSRNATVREFRELPRAFYTVSIVHRFTTARSIITTAGGLPARPVRTSWWRRWPCPRPKTQKNGNGWGSSRVYLQR